MAQVLMLSSATETALPALDLLSHRVHTLPASASSLVDAPQHDLVIVDGRADLPQARSLCRLLAHTEGGAPVLLLLTEGGLAAVSADWGIDDLLLGASGPAEVDARFRVAMGRAQERSRNAPIESSGVTIDEANYSAKLRGRTLDLTYKEFELLRFLASHPSRVFTREQLLSEVWGYDYFGGTRTVDVHVRRLRAKLGDLESLIGTVRNVGYRFTANEDGNAHTTTD